MENFYIVTTKYTIRTHNGNLIEIEEFNGTVSAENENNLNGILTYLCEVARNAIRIGDVEKAVIYVRDIESNALTNVIKEVHI